MTPIHDSFQRSRRGGLIRSPHGQFNDERFVGHPPRDQLLIVSFIDEAVYRPHEEDRTGYIPILEADPAPGLARWEYDASYWAAVELGYAVVVWLIHVKGTDEISDQLTPDGESNPQSLHFSAEDRPITTITAGLDIGLTRSLGRITAKTGDPIALQGLHFAVDASGSMLGAFGGSAGTDPTSIVQAITTELRSRGAFADGVDVVPTVRSYLYERWVREQNVTLAMFYDGLDVPPLGP